MSIEIITLLMVGSLLFLVLIGMPLAFALGFVAVGFAYTFFGFSAIQLIASRIYGFVNVYVLLSVPMFLLMAAIMDRSGVARDLYDAISVWAGGLPGGVAVMTLVAAVFMAATTGIIGGEIILLGLVAMPQMLRLGYHKNLAIGTICAGGSLGTMIPPSIVLIFYGLTANVAIGDLFIAVVMPGLLLAGFYLVYILIRCALNPKLGPPLPFEERDIPLSEKLGLLKGLILPMGIAFGVLASIYAGVAAVAEAAAVGVAGTILAAWLRGALGWESTARALGSMPIVTTSVSPPPSCAALPLRGRFNCAIRVMSDQFLHQPGHSRPHTRELLPHRPALANAQHHADLVFVGPTVVEPRHEGTAHGQRGRTFQFRVPEHLAIGFQDRTAEVPLLPGRSVGRDRKRIAGRCQKQPAGGVQASEG